VEFLAPLLQRNVIIGLAVGGGLLALIGSFLLRRKASTDPRLARLVLRSGYAITWLSVALFIAVGFFGPDRLP
jgi:hypothetical protein